MPGRGGRGNNLTHRGNVFTIKLNWFSSQKAFKLAFAGLFTDLPNKHTAVVHISIISSEVIENREYRT